MHSSSADPSSEPLKLFACLQEEAAVRHLYWDPPAICQPDEEAWESGLPMYCLQTIASVVCQS